MTPPSSPPPPDPTPTPTQNPETTPPETTPPDLYKISFNQNSTYFSAATSTGFTIYETIPFKVAIRRSFSPPRGISIVQMLYRYNIFALVGGGPQPQYPPHKVMIWDDTKSACVSELRFRSHVKSVRLRRDKIIVSLTHRVYVYDFADLKYVEQIDTAHNPDGLCEVSTSRNNFVLVCPGLYDGQIRVENFGSAKRTRFIMAHSSKLHCLALTNDGRFLASASTKGTLIRVFYTLNGHLLREVRRGTEKAEIHSLAFSSDVQWLVASSDRGTIHVFSLKLNSDSPESNGLPSQPEQPSSPRSPMASISFMKGVLPKYFSSEWSFAQFHLSESLIAQGTRHIAAFGEREGTVLVVGMDGSYYRCEFDPVAGGKMKQLEHHNFLKPEVSHPED